MFRLEKNVESKIKFMLNNIYSVSINVAHLSSLNSSAVTYFLYIFNVECKKFSIF